ncbi:hypothetical protein KC336_g11 [Hortaea werneckii]|nr:hypothetical protein KC336_g11 [Hortaea werneckii]
MKEGGHSIARSSAQLYPSCRRPRDYYCEPMKCVYLSWVVLSQWSIQDSGRRSWDAVFDFLRRHGDELGPGPLLARNVEPSIFVLTIAYGGVQ